MPLYLACSSGGAAAAAAATAAGLGSQSLHRGLGRGQTVGIGRGMQESFSRALWMC